MYSLFLTLVGIIVLLVGYGRLGGTRRRRPAFIVGGWVILGLQAVGVLMCVVWTAPYVNRVAAKSSDQLLADIEADWDAAWPEYSELIRRLKNGELSDSEGQEFGRIAMEEYARTTKAVSKVEIDVINTLRTKGLLSPAGTDRFFLRLVELKMTAAPTVEGSGQARLRIDVRPLCVWSGGGLWCTVQFKPSRRPNGWSANGAAYGWTQTNMQLGNASGLLTLLSPAPEGPLILQVPQLATLRTMVDVGDLDKAALTYDARIDYYDENPAAGSARPINTITKKLHTVVSFVPAADLEVRLVSNPRPTRGGGFGAWDIECRSFDVIQSPAGPLIQMTILNENAQMNCAFDVSVFMVGEDRAAGTICQAKGETMEWIATVPCGAREPHAVLLTLTPNRELAAEAGFQEIYGEPVIIRDIR